MVEQGQIIKIDGIKFPALVVSKNVFNESGRVIVCPVVSEAAGATLAYPIGPDKYVLCDNLRQLDLNSRFYSITDRVSLAGIINISDRVQSLFDYL
jgi:mRNA-degrading endonuclease toxin of MazEF toxin-antitoxin module